ncbi:MAG: Asp-tRNA(Asn)/Glu-tRNA(Gln) amidotransferase subunit GatA [Deltaproteobacteria bacterium]|nr:Asp-tRNA(Asn)/Glu-tRNA(Gln) amidotransferase subunit GatA [Deltaproteobacteria bacterium]
MRAGRLSAREVTVAAIQRARRTHEVTNALYRIDAAGGLAAAEAVDASVASGADPGPLAGVPIVLKDNICQHGQPCTCGSRILEDHVASYDAFSVGRLRTAGAVLVGRANMDEFAMGSSTETCAWGPVRNPWDPDRVPGGSSGGSAAAVAAGAVPLALGSETGGSVRLPAAFCGVVGVKPTWGRVSRRGLVAYASSTDQIAPVARSVTDAALLTEVVAGHDPRDSTSKDRPVDDLQAACRCSIEGLKLGVPREYYGQGLDDGVRGAIASALDSLREQGVELVDISLPSTDLAVACYYVIAPAEASANLARFDGVRYGRRASADTAEEVVRRTRSTGFGTEVKRRILIGTWVLSAGYVDAYYRVAQRVRATITAELDRVLEQVDALITPTAAPTAFRFNERNDPLAMYLTDVYTIPPSLAGLPAISVPCSLCDGLPVGLQVIGRRFDEASCFAIAAAVERARPPLPLPPLWSSP